MRTNANVQVGQRWESSDPRRLFLIEIADITGDVALLETLYPKGRLQRAVTLDRFQITGSKGYTRVS